ncbi:MAG: hypothetical protein AB8B55_06665 [Mariniblastus sp.]
MKFSIRFLLALLVLSALLANYFVIRQSRERIKAEEAEVIAQSDMLLFKEREAVSFGGLYRIALSGEQLLNTKYEAAYEANKDLPYIVSELVIEDTSKISYRNLPLLAEGRRNHIAFRIYVPTSSPVFLSTTFGNGKIAFESSEDHTVQLAPGHHIVDYQFDYVDEGVLKLLIDKKEAFSIRTRSPLNGYSLVGTPAAQRDLEDLKKPQRMIRLEPHLKSAPSQGERPFMLVHIRGANDGK